MAFRDIYSSNFTEVLIAKPIEKSITWLLEGDPWVRYRTRLDLIQAGENDALVEADFNAILKDKRIKKLFSELEKWPGKVIKNHSDDKLLLHKLSFLADIGFTINYKPIQDIVDNVRNFQSKEGPYQVLLNIPKKQGGLGKNEFGWILCDAPSILYALVKFGLEEDESVQKALHYLILKVKNNGWGCTASNAIEKKFHGPGKTTDPCPYSNLLMLKVLAQSKTWKYSSACHKGTDTLLDLWENSYSKHPFQFKMGSDFRKLKAPMIWYDILHVADVLSQFEWVRNDPRFLDLINIITTKANIDSQYTSDSIWEAWENWDFGQINNPSRWLTFLVLRILTRIENGAI